MKSNNCLNDQDLILHFYGELAEDDTRKQHLASCPLCAERLCSLARELARLPSLDYEPDHFTSTRMAARVSEKTRQPDRKPLIAAISVAATATLMIVMTFILLPEHQVDQLAQAGPAVTTAIEIEDSMPDIDLLEDLELLQELELLTQIEGV